MTQLINEEIRYRLLRYLGEHPEASQRELARHLGISGKVNYCLRFRAIAGTSTPDS